MEIIELTEASEALAELRNIPIQGQADLPFTLLSPRDNKTAKLVANSGEVTAMNGSNRWYDYSFSEPVFLSEIIVETENYSSFTEFEFKWTLAQGGEVSQDLARGVDNPYRAPINQLVQKVSFRPPKLWWTDTKINRVQLVGFQVKELEEFVRLVSRLEDYKRRVVADSERAVTNAETANGSIDTLTTKRDELNVEVSDSTTKLADLEKSIGRSTAERKVILEDISKREDAISSLESDLTSIDELITHRRSESSHLATKISEQWRESRSLQDDINMFPTEISGFVSQGTRTIRTYWILAALPIILLVFVTGLLVSNAANLTTVTDEANNARIFSILVTRMPFVIIASAIIGAAYKLARVFVAEIMRINQQRLNLSKISIVATDVSQASEDGLEDLSDEDIYELRTQLKMNMLRDHLKEYLSKDFAYTRRTPLDLVKQPIQPSDSEDIISDTLEDDD